jgi:hypothetical protein
LWNLEADLWWFGQQYIIYIDIDIFVNCNWADTRWQYLVFCCSCHYSAWLNYCQWLHAHFK